MAHQGNTQFDATPPNDKPDLKLVEGFDETPKSFKVPKFAKLLGGTALGLVVVAGLAGIAATQLIDQAHYKKIATEKIAEKTGYTVNWEGNIGLSLLPMPHVSVSNLSVANKDQMILSVKSASVDVALIPLLSQKIDIKNITVDTPVVTLLTNKSGQQTWMTDVLKKAEKTSDAVPSAADAKTEAPLDISVNQINITDGTFVWDDQSSATKKMVERVDVRLNAESLSGPFDLNGNMQVSGQTIDIKLTSGKIDGNGSQIPVQLAVDVPKSNINANFSGSVDIVPAPKASGDITIQVGDISDAAQTWTGNALSLPNGLGGKLNVAGKVVSSDKRMALDDMIFSLGNLSYKGGLSVSGYGEATPPVLAFSLTPTAKSDETSSPLVNLLSDLNISGKGSVADGKINIENATLNAQGNDLTLRGSIATKNDVRLDLNVSSRKMDLDGLQKKLSNNEAGSSKNSSSAAISEKPSKISGFSVPFSGHIAANLAQVIVGGKTYSNIAADITNGKSGFAISSLKATLPAATSVELSGTIADTQNLSGLNIKVDAKTADTEKLLNTFMTTPPSLPQTVGAASLEGHFVGSLDDMSFDTTAGMRGLSLSGKGSVRDVLAKPIISSLQFTAKHESFTEAVRIFSPSFEGGRSFAGPLSLAGQVKWSDKQYQISELKGALGPTTVGGDIVVNMSAKPDVSGTLTFGDIVLPTSSKAAANAASAASGGASSSGGAGGHWSREQIDMSFLKAFDADVKISARSITQNLWILGNANLDAKLKNGTLNIADLSANLFGGKAALNGTIRAGAGDSDPLSVDAKLSASNVNARSAMSAAMGASSDTISGTLTNMDVALNATGTSQATLVQTLSGNGALTGTDLIVKGVDAAQLAQAAKGSYKPLERAGSLFESFGNGQTEFSEFNSDFVIQSGIVNFTKIYFDGPKATLTSTGNVNLPQWSVDLKNSMTVKDTDLPPFDFTVRGPLDNPTKAGGSLINNYLQNKLQKNVNKFLENKLGKFLGAPAETTAPAAEAVDGVEAVPATETPAVNNKEKAAQEAVKALQGLFGKH